jgi:uncharacterized membrane protein
MANAKLKPEMEMGPEAALAHLYRGELDRSDRWRMRLDTTTNWALTTTAAVISFGFATRATPHVIFLAGIWMVGAFLFIEARRYQYYDLWQHRVRLLEDGFWAPILRREALDADSLRELALELARPQIQLSLFSAIGTRLNRAYGPVLLVLLLSWFVKVYSHPTPAQSAIEFLMRAHVGPVGGLVVTALLAALTLFAALAFASTFLARAPLGELPMRPRAHHRALWEIFARPYELKRPRTHQKGVGVFNPTPDER